LPYANRFRTPTDNARRDVQSAFVPQPRRIRTTQEHRSMNKDQVKGRVDQATGKVKEVTGKALDDERLESEGRADQASGEVRKDVGDAKENVKDAVDKGIDKL
jgi:uncharacterized protein YjbJ (UPF0337 family)